jgi:hypothetical protein
MIRRYLVHGCLLLAVSVLTGVLHAQQGDSEIPFRQSV